MTILDEAQTPAPTTAIREFLRNSISIADVSRQLWGGRLVLLAALAFGLVYGLYQAHRAGPQYMALVTVMPAQGESEGGGGGAMGVLASLTGGGGAQGGKMIQFLFTIGSVGVAEAMDRKYDSLCIVYRGLCDPKTHTWKERTGLNAAIDGFLARVAGLPNPNGPLTIIDLAHYNQAAIVVIKDKESPRVTLSYNNRDPKFAADYLTKVIETTNNYNREQDRATARNMVDYVARRIATNTNVEQRLALDNLLLQQERRLMMTEVSAPYAATVLDGPVVTPVNNVLRTTLIDSFLFLILGVAMVLFRNLVPEQFRFWSRTWKRS